MCDSKGLAGIHICIYIYVLFEYAYTAVYIHLCIARSTNFYGTKYFTLCSIKLNSTRNLRMLIPVVSKEQFFVR